MIMQKHILYASINALCSLQTVPQPDIYFDLSPMEHILDTRIANVAKKNITNLPFDFSIFETI